MKGETLDSLKEKAQAVLQRFARLIVDSMMHGDKYDVELIVKRNGKPISNITPDASHATCMMVAASMCFVRDLSKTGMDQNEFNDMIQSLLKHFGVEDHEFLKHLAGMGHKFTQRPPKGPPS
jgi:hypothetical protein